MTYTTAILRTTVLALFILMLSSVQGLTAPTGYAAGTATNVMVTRDASGKTIGVQRNPESDMLLDEPAPRQASRKAAAPLSPVRLLNNLLTMALILFVLYIVLLAVKKYQSGQRLPLPGLTGTPRPARAIQVLESASLGQGRGLHLVQVGGRCFLVGTSLQQVTLLGDVTEDAEIKALFAQVQAGGTGSTPFQQLLNRFYPTQDSAPSADATGKEYRP